MAKDVAGIGAHTELLHRDCTTTYKSPGGAELYKRLESILGRVDMPSLLKLPVYTTQPPFSFQ
jgi:hypothetical protein